MKGKLAIRADALSKLYRLGERQAYFSLRESLASGFSRFLSRKKPSDPETIWALRDLSFEVPRGEVLGIIGRNGAGKSTLLKILSRITQPSQGRAEIHGRIGSLLEVGTGFHPELTGRENIFLSGAILGMTRREIQSKFDQIVAFAEVERFMDTPVKRYSSGMYLRLAFAVVAHLEPEILLVDEVLAVGDAAFQRKCLARSDEIARGGRTVLLVSHNMAAIQRLCTSVLILDSGRRAFFGPVEEAVRRYLAGSTSALMSWSRSTPPSKDAWIESLELLDRDNPDRCALTTASRLTIIVQFSIRRPIEGLQLSVDILGSLDEVLFVTLPQDAGMTSPSAPGSYRAEILLPAEILMERSYGLRVNLYLPMTGTIDRVDELRFDVEPGRSLSTLSPTDRAGSLAIRCGWTIDLLDDLHEK